MEQKTVSPFSKKLRAFSLGEVLIAAFVLTTGILAVVGLITFSYRNSVDTQDLIIASELAQEGVEVVRNVRDNSIVYRLYNWTTGPNCQASTTGSCDPFGNTIPNGVTLCRMGYRAVVVNCPIPLVTTGLVPDVFGFSYAHQGGTRRYWRLLKINKIGIGNDATVRVQSFVTWQDPTLLPNGGLTDLVNLDQAITNCTIFNKCVYTELLLTAWK